MMVHSCCLLQSHIGWFPHTIFAKCLLKPLYVVMNSMAGDSGIGDCGQDSLTHLQNHHQCSDVCLHLQLPLLDGLQVGNTTSQSAG
jgi:hypothetical protein